MKCTGSQYPKNVKLHFENKSTALRRTCRVVHAIDHAEEHIECGDVECSEKYAHAEPQHLDRPHKTKGAVLEAVCNVEADSQASNEHSFKQVHKQYIQKVACNQMEFSSKAEMIIDY